MDKLFNTTKVVKAILEADEKARNDDKYLTWLVIQRTANQKGISLEGVTIETYLASDRFSSFPSFETIRRTRQKVQQSFPHLQSDEDTAKERKARERAFRSFAREL